MIIYTLLIFYVIFLSIIYAFKKNKSKKTDKIFLIMAFIPMIIIMGFRGRTVGTDTYSYTVYFQQICDYSLTNALNFFPLGWVILNKVIGATLGIEPINYIFIVSMLTLILFMKFIYDNSINVSISTILFILFFHYFSAFNGMRQYLAVAIVANSYKYLMENKNIKFILINLIATSIHPTAILFLCLIPIKMIKPTIGNIYKILFFSIFFILLLGPIAQIFVNIFPHYALYLDESGIGTFGFGQGKNRNVIITFIYIFFEIFMLIKMKNKENLKIEEHYMYVIINLIGILFCLLSLTNTLFNRLSWYFIIFAIIYIPYCFKFFNGKDRFYLNILFIAMMFIPCYIQLYEGISNVVPFSWIW